MNQFNLSRVAYVAGLPIIDPGNSRGHLINASAVGSRDHSFRIAASLDPNRFEQDGQGSHFFHGIKQLGYTQETAE